MRSFDITAIINAHNEGILLASTLESVRLAVEKAAGAGVSVEVVAVGDRCDYLTSEVMGNFHLPNMTVIDANNGDLAASRNEGVEAAKGRFVAFLDGDDLWGPDWLVLALEAAEQDQRECVWHPEINLYFTESQAWYFHHPDMDDIEFDPWRQLVTNCWTALSFAKVDVYRKFPYTRNDLSKGTGYEDWSWNSSVMAGGIVHKTVPGTCHFIRKKQFSMVQETNQSGALVSRHNLYHHLVNTPSYGTVRSA